MKVEDHEKAYQEHLKNLNKAVEGGIEENQRNIGYNASQGAVELFAIYLHKLNLLQGSGDQLDHRIFRSENLIGKRIPFEFSAKKDILELMKSIEDKRNVFCYGKRKAKREVENFINNFQKLRKIINSNLKNGKNNKKK